MDQTLLEMVNLDISFRTLFPSSFREERFVLALRHSVKQGRGMRSRCEAVG
jgi:hypothetical protein